MRAIKTTTIKFGLVSVPVKMYAAVDDHDVKMSQFHKDCGGGISYQKTCKVCEQHLDTSEIDRGVIRDDKQIVISEEELNDLAGQVGPEVAVLKFIDINQIDPIMLEKHYFCAPSAAADLEGFSLLRTVMAESNLAAVVRFVMRRSGTTGKSHTGILRPYGKALALDILSYADEIREPAFSVLDNPITLNKALLDAARTLVQALTGEFDPQEFSDDYTRKLVGLIEAKANGKGTKAVKTAAPEPVVSDLLAKLTASAAAKAAAKPPAKKAAPCKVAAKKAPAKKAAAPRRKEAVA